MPVQSVLTQHDLRDLCLSILERAAWSLEARVPGRRTGLNLARNADARRSDILMCQQFAGPAFVPVFDEIRRAMARLLDPLPPDPSPFLADVCRLAAALQSGDIDVTLPDSRNSQFRLAPNGSRWTLEFGGALAKPKYLSMTAAEWHGLSDAQRFLAAVTQTCAAWRNQGQPRMPPNDQLALERGAQLVERGIPLPRVFLPLLTSGLRPVQTYLSLADPGPGHIEVTAVHRDLLEGTVVHIEYIDRGKIAEKGITEAYRIPSIRHVARLRLMLGDTTPCSVYVGRPVFESKRFENDLLKSAHTIASACSALFGLGVAECKIAMDGMSASETVQFMNAVVGNTLRDPSTQRLSAAFNLNPDKNSGFLDDRDSEHQPKRVVDRLKLAKLAIELTLAGQFDKVTWDGAGDGQSQPIIGQLTPVDFLDLVHKAHRQGLETYISAGMDADHIRTATTFGIGGVGIGTKLHERDPETQAIGRLLPDKVQTVLNNRNRAAESPAGQAAQCLARLDWLYFEVVRHRELQEYARHVEQLGDALYRALRDYLAEAAESARIDREPILQRLTQSATDEIFSDLSVRIARITGPSQWKPYELTLGSPDPTAAVAAEPPLLASARLVYAAYQRELELLQCIAPPRPAPLGSKEKFEELKRLIDELDLPGIHDWFQD